MLVSFRTIPARVRARIASEAGFTLIETLVAAALSLVVFAAVLSALATSQHTQSRDQEWALVIQEARAGAGRMVSEMRQAYAVKEDSESKIVFYATIGGKSWEISYNCAEKQASTEFNECVRRAAEFSAGKPPGELPASGAPIVKDVLNETKADEKDRVFVEYTPNAIAPDLVTVKLVMPASGTLKLASAGGYTHHVVLENGAYIRDMALGA